MRGGDAHGKERIQRAAERPRDRGGGRVGGATAHQPFGVDRQAIGTGAAAIHGTAAARGRV